VTQETVAEVQGLRTTSGRIMGLGTTSATTMREWAESVSIRAAYLQAAASDKVTRRISRRISQMMMRRPNHKHRIKYNIATIVANANKVYQAEGGSALKFSRLQVDKITRGYYEILGSRWKTANGLDCNDFSQMYHFDPEELQCMFECFDQDNDKCVSLQEIICGLGFLCKGTIEEKLVWLYRKYDLDGSGQLDREEIVTMLLDLMKKASLLHLVAVRNCTIRMSRSSQKDLYRLLDVEKLVDKVFRQYDINSDGVIDNHEFAMFMVQDEMASTFARRLEHLANRVLYRGVNKPRDQDKIVMMANAAQNNDRGWGRTLTPNRVNMRRISILDGGGGRPLS
jgi:Ca2+-binding EF-hand superfamily protein